MNIKNNNVEKQVNIAFKWIFISSHFPPLAILNSPVHNGGLMVTYFIGGIPPRKESSMADLMGALKAEISRLARKEVKKQTADLKKACSQHYHTIATLRRTISELERRVAQLTGGASALKTQAVSTTRSSKESGNAGDSDGKTIRFSGTRLKKHRKKLGLTAANYAQLLGVSSLSIHNWETGKSRPRPSYMPALAELRGIGRREALKRLEATSN